MIHCTLKQVVKKRGWSLYRLAKEADISYPTALSLYHNRSRMFSAPVLEKLCRTLRCQVGDLLVCQPKRKNRA
jgi:DNA-binding Xre family transcriptional regulator